MLRRIFSPIFGKKKRGQLIINPGYIKKGNYVTINVREFDKGSGIFVYCFGPFDKKPFFDKSDFINNNGSLMKGDIKIPTTTEFPSGDYNVIVQGKANKVDSKITKKFTVK